MVGLMVSGIVLSRQVFAFLPISGGASFARLLHMVASYWGFVLMSLHLGLHRGMLTGMAGKAVKLLLPAKTGFIVSFVRSTAVALYDLTVFLRRDLPTYMLLRTLLVFLDFSSPTIIAWRQK